VQRIALDNFGIIICCCRFDSFFAQGCVASVRHFYPDVPVTLFTDDTFDTRGIERGLGISVLRREDIQDPFLRQTNTGWGLPKMTPFWEGPYERFLYLDADTIVWGDVIARHLQGDDWDFVADVGDVEGRPWTPGVGTDAWLRKEYFNPEVMEQALPDFDWRRYAPWFFCTGTFAARRGAFDLEDYKRLLHLRETVPGLFPVGEMPLLNTLIFRAHQRGTIRLRRTPMQMLCDYTNADWLPQRFKFAADGPDVTKGDEMVLHFTEPKPALNSDGFNAPFTYFRRQAMRRIGGWSGWILPISLRMQELEWRATKAWRRHGGRYHRIIAPLIAPIRRRYRGGR
jgi:hypothetical protein